MPVCKTRGARLGFTLVEVMIVLAILALMATMVLPKGFFSFEPPLRSLQRATMEISDIALGGYSVRMRMEVDHLADRGRIVIEALSQVADASDPRKQTLAWLPLKILHPLEGYGWRLEPGIIYFYADGTCTPARIFRADEDTRIEDGETAFLTVTGFLFEKKKDGS